MSEKKEYVERGAFLNWLNKRMDEVGTDEESRFYVNQTMTILESYPAADVEPVVRGYWMKEECIVCSHCGMPAAWAKPSLKKQLESNYCASCGAHMMERSGSGE